MHDNTNRIDDSILGKISCISKFLTFYVEDTKLSYLLLKFTIESFLKPTISCVQLLALH